MKICMACRIEDHALCECEPECDCSCNDKYEDTPWDEDRRALERENNRRTWHT